MLLGLAALLVTLLPQDPETAEPPEAGTRSFLEVEVQVDGAEQSRMSFGFEGSEGWTVYLMSTEGRQGVSAVIGGFGRTPGPEEKSGLTVLFFIHFYGNSQSLVEVQLLNDAKMTPAGRIGAAYKISYLGEILGEGRQFFPDQAGVMFWGGKPQFAPRLDLWNKYTAGFPGAGESREEITSAVARKPDPDPVRGMDVLDSSRNRYVAVEAFRYSQTQDSGYLAQLLDFTAAQSRRPYHITGDTGEPFFQADHPDAVFVDGRPEPTAFRENFGRVLLTPAQMDADGFGGWNPENLNVEELYATYLMTGSRIARRELVLIAEELSSTQEVATKDSPQQSAQTFGWVARSLVRAYQATGTRAYMDAVRRMITSVRVHRQVDGPYQALVPQGSDPNFLPDERWESPAAVAVAASALALYLSEAPNDEQAMEQLEFCGDLLVDQGYSEEKGGFFEVYSAQSAAKKGDGSLREGAALMIPSALVEIAALMPVEKRAHFLGPAKRMFELARLQPYGEPASLEYQRWLLRAAREFQ